MTSGLVPRCIMGDAIIVVVVLTLRALRGTFGGFVYRLVCLARFLLTVFLNAGKRPRRNSLLGRLDLLCKE